MLRKKRNNFRRTRQNQKRPLKKILLLTLLILTIYFFLFSSFFNFKTIRFEGEAETATSLTPKIEETLKPYLDTHLFKLSTEEIQTLLNKNFPEITNIKVTKKYPKGLEIEFEKHALKANIINESANTKKNYIVNSIGLAVKEDFESPNLPYIHIITEEPLNPKTSLIKSSELDYIIKSVEDFNTRFGMKILSVRFKPVARELHLFTEKEFYIWLDIQQPYDTQFKKLKKSLPKLDIYNLPLQYIDLRIAGNEGDRIIYKPK